MNTVLRIGSRSGGSVPDIQEREYDDKNQGKRQECEARALPTIEIHVCGTHGRFTGKSKCLPCRGKEYGDSPFFSAAMN